MELGAFLLVPEIEFIPNDNDDVRENSHAGTGLPLWPVVGKNLVEDWAERIRRIGVQVLSVTHSANPSRDKITTARELANQGVKQVLAVSLNSYAEIDLRDLVQFHRQSSSPLTEAFDAEGPLGVEIMTRASFAGTDSPCQEPAGNDDAAKYPFNGYAKRLRSPQLYRDLVSDALRGHCALRPRGSQIDEQVWIGEQTRIAPSVRFFGPCFVGDGAVLHDFVSLGPFSSVENGCRIDCGTTVEQSSVLPNTFLAAGLNVRGSIVDGPRLEQLDSGTVVNLRDCALGGRIHPRTRVLRNHTGGHSGRPVPACVRPAPLQVEPWARAAAMIDANPL